MAKRKFRIEGGRYGGEAVIGEVSPGFASYFAKEDEGDVIDAVLEADDWTNSSNDQEPEDALLNPDSPPYPGIEPDGFYIWENDNFDHINGPYSDGGFFVYEVPADGSDDWDYDKEVFEGDGQYVYGREGGLFGTDEPDVINETDEDGNKYVPVLAFHSAEKGGFGCWFAETDGEDFDPFKLGYGIVETNVAEIIESVYYDKEELEYDSDGNDTTGKSYHASVGWINIKWRDAFDSVKIDWEDFDENVKWEKENS